jgi:hypothetical protein
VQPTGLRLAERASTRRRRSSLSIATTGSFQWVVRSAPQRRHCADSISSVPPVQVHTVLGVLYNLSYQYDHAAEAFSRALEVHCCGCASLSKATAALGRSTVSVGAVSPSLHCAARSPVFAVVDCTHCICIS